MSYQVIGLFALWYSLCNCVKNISQGEEVIPGVRKNSRQNKWRDYTFSRQIMGRMTISNYALQLAESGFINRHGLTATLEKGVIYLDGEGFPHDSPRIIFSEGGVRLVVPYSLEDYRSWDVIVRDMKDLFYASREVTARLIPGITVVMRQFDESRRYQFQSKRIANVTKKALVERLRRSELLGDFGLHLSREDHDGVIMFDGAEVSSDKPRIIISKQSVCLTVSHSPDDKRNWDAFALRMRNLLP